MNKLHSIELTDRGLLAIHGPETRSYLQALVSNDMENVSPSRALYGALLTPQGKFLHDFFISALGETLLFDCEGARAHDLERRLVFYRLRAKSEIENFGDDFAVYALIGEGGGAALSLADAPGSAAPFAGGVVYRDPRLAAMGLRAALPRGSAVAALQDAGFTAAPFEDYDRLRLSHGIPDGSRDIVVEKGFLLENGIDDLGGVDFTKGCYIGQELTARTKHRATIRKRLLRVDVDGALPPSGTPVMFGDKQAGEMRSGRGQVGLAMLRLELVAEAAAAGRPFSCADATLTPVKPDWASF